jgi:hypothetical protein
MHQRITHLRKIKIMMRCSSLLLFIFFSTLLACELDSVYEFSEVCPPRDSRCCPEGMDTCTAKDMLNANRCYMHDEKITTLAKHISVLMKCNAYDILSTPIFVEHHAQTPKQPA